MKQEDNSKYLKFLNENKKLVGLSDWKITISKKYLDDGNFAEVEPNIYEKELEVTLSKQFYGLQHVRKKNVLLHELIHGRVEIFNKRKEQIVEELEEDMVNDITRGFERHKPLTWE